MDNYHRMSLNDREEISRNLAMGMSLRHIARTLNRHPSTIHREIYGVGMSRLTYRAKESEEIHVIHTRLRRLGKHKLKLNPKLWLVVQELLKNYWSPQQIVNRLRKEYPNSKAMHLCHETIYSYLFVLPKGELKKELLSSLRRDHKRRHKRRDKPSYPPEGLVSIEERPEEIKDRVIPGHWEGDLILGQRCQSALGTLVERKTRFLMLVPLKSKAALDVQEAFSSKVKHLPEQLRKTLTYDQGSEMTSHHRLFTKNTRMKVYFAHLKSPWERGTNENTNGLIRQFFPKGTNFNQVDPKEIERVEYLINGRPRRVLDWDKPCEAFARVLR